ncbi:FAD-dependent oxidoreductase [Maridesulfovibrio salexigens]|uniref:Glucose-inhibited division protein A n=1 Tax=Maridesulfovibrio salexigens (strain ATCC 14822 / DSM 2638 / NCIMB 8403 / VKM B-1763) TaxID=526222 RepID=C6BUC3_MARSD|nr:FAD-dependent oxidoreductase [Maridesulfovibrio salexigens]ACS79932.1 glucose-inhibited division protein A [Maridesulfovibrio salexigens DSM 2638]
MSTIIVIGGGWSGCAAALAARKNNSQVILLERTDLLLGCGLAGGIMRNNGRYTAAEELRQLGAGELIKATDRAATHVDIDFPGHEHATLYSTSKVESSVRRLLTEKSIDLRFISRVADIQCSDGYVQAVKLADNKLVKGDVFIDCTGSAGSMGNCHRYGTGCAMCMLRCPSFGPRISLTDRMGIKDIVGMRQDGAIGSLSGSCEIRKESLSEDIQLELKQSGVSVTPLPEQLIHESMLNKKSCRQYALPDFARNIVLLDTGGHAKMMTPYFPIDKLRMVPGFTDALYSHGSSMANSVRFLSRAPRNDLMKVTGTNNLFCGGEKSGFFVGHTEAMVTGTLAGYNAAALINDEEQMHLPRELACGDIIAAESEGLNKENGLKQRYTFSGGIYFEQMQKRELYLVDKSKINTRVNDLGLTGIFDASSNNEAA